MSGKLSRRVMRSQNRAPFGSRVEPTPHFDDDCPLCRMARDEGLETRTISSPTGFTTSVTVVPKGWRPPS